MSFAAKAADKTIPLGALFIAVQLLDVFWGSFVLLGIEKVRVVPGITAANPLDLYYMPYTHSLVAALLWSLAAYAAYRLIRRAGASPRAALLVAAGGPPGLGDVKRGAVHFATHVTGVTDALPSASLCAAPPAAILHPSPPSSAPSGVSGHHCRREHARTAERGTDRRRVHAGR